MRSLKSGNGNFFAGFSLIEVMLGMFVLGLTLLASLAALPETRKLSYRSDAMRMGFTHMNATIEGFRTQTFEQMAEAVEDAQQSDYNRSLLGKYTGNEDAQKLGKVSHTLSHAEQNGIRYDIHTFLNYIDAEEHMIQATVVVFWDFLQEEQVISCHSVFSEDGLSDKKFNTAN